MGDGRLPGNVEQRFYSELLQKTSGVSWGSEVRGTSKPSVGVKF